MFYYYGGKMNLAKHYPRPRYRTVVEPFAGSAAYGVRCLMEGSADRLILRDLDPRVVEMWQRLLSMTPEDVLALAPITKGTRTTDPLAMTVMASNSWGASRGYTVTERMEIKWPDMLRNIARALPRVVGRVTIELADYTTARQGGPATYFVDPPYQMLGQGGRRGNGYRVKADALDFYALGEWCRSLDGHVIAVDHASADWLPFKPFRGHRSTATHLGRKNLEGIWTRGGIDEQGDLTDLLEDGAA